MVMFLSQPMSTAGVLNPICMWKMHIKHPLLLMEKCSGFLQKNINTFYVLLAV